MEDAPARENLEGSSRAASGIAASEAVTANLPRRGVIITLAAAAYVAVPLYVAPVLATAYVSTLGFSVEQPGYVVSAEMAGMGLATLPALWWLNRLDWGRLASAMLILIAALDALSILAVSPLNLCAIRFLAGLAEGTVSIVCMSSLRLTRNPNRSFGFWLFTQLCVGALVLAALPGVLRAAGVAGFFGAAALLAVALVWPARWIRGGHQLPHNGAGDVAVENEFPWTGVSGLAAVLAFYVAFSSIWTFVAEIARVNGIAADRAGYVLSFAPVGGMLGAALAAGAASRFGRIGPLAVGTATLAAASWVLGSRMSLAWYASAAMALMLAWTFVIPQLMGGLAAVDRTGRLTVAVNVSIGAGLAAGPALGGLILASAGGYRAVASMALVLAIASFVLAIPMLHAGRGSR